MFAPASGSLIVKGINGPVGWVGNAFATATADALREKGLLASSRWQNQKSFVLAANGYQQLYEDRPPDLIVTWLLTDKEGNVKKTLKTRITPPEQFWINPTKQIFRQVVTPKTEEIIKWLRSKDDSITKGQQTIRISIGSINGLTEPHGKVFRKRLIKTLRQHNVKLVNNGVQSLVLSATVRKISIGHSKKEITIVWTLSSPDKEEIGRIKQSNSIDKIKIANNWDEISNQISLGAIDGILDLVGVYRYAKR
ncbi:MAG: hypothetical protein VX987_09075 [Pseudomonadota bacterium]|nr:hypothetical protein [Pseudomonadota bacterium]